MDAQLEMPCNSFYSKTLGMPLEISLQRSAAHFKRSINTFCSIKQWVHQRLTLNCNFHRISSSSNLDWTDIWKQFTPFSMQTRKQRTENQGNLRWKLDSSFDNRIRCLVSYASKPFAISFRSYFHCHGWCNWWELNKVCSIYIGNEVKWVSYVFTCSCDQYN